MQGGRIKLDGWTWALLFARWVLGVMFVVAGLWKVFDLGLLEYAERYVVADWARTWVPVWVLWAVGTVAPFVELASGALLCLGLRVRGACIAVGVLLVGSTLGQLALDPLFGLEGPILPRLLLLLFVLVGPRGRDETSLDFWLERRGASSD